MKLDLISFVREEEKICMWDIVTPILYITFLANLFYSFNSYKKESVLHFSISLLIQLIISFLSLWSIGQLLFILCGIQILFLGRLIIRKRNII